jgi:hypothetical protein
MRKPSPAMMVALASLFVALGGVGMAATGGNFILGQSNSANQTTALSSGVTTGPTLSLTNTGGKPAARLAANSGPPFTVSNGTKIPSLNADLLDAHDSAYFLPASGTAVNSNALGGHPASYFLPKTGKAADSDKLDGLDSTMFARAQAPVWTPVSGTTTEPNSNPGKFVCYDWVIAPPPGQNCWANLPYPGASNWSTAAYTKDSFGFVHLRGVVTCVPDSLAGAQSGDLCSLASGTNVIFALPPGYRPSQSTIFPSSSTNGSNFGTVEPQRDTFARITVDPTGNVLAETGNTLGYMSLDGITFAAG